MPIKEPQRGEYKEEYLSPQVNIDGSAAWIMRVQFDRITDELKPKEPEKNSIWMWHEWPEGLLEYANEKIIVALNPNTFLFLDNWRSMSYVQTNDTSLLCMKPHPDFDLQVFPFLVVSGNNHMSVINVNEYTV